MPKLQIDRELYLRAEACARKRGYSSVDEFIAHLLELALREQEETSAEEAAAVEKRLKGLGYIE
jgi:hypothetical protein